MKQTNAAEAASTHDFIYIMPFIPDTCAPAAPCLGPLTKIILSSMVDGVVQANLISWTIRAMISLAWSMWSRWSMQIQPIARACARACVFGSFVLTIIFNLYKNTSTTRTKPMWERFFSSTTLSTETDHPDQKGYKDEL